MEKPQAESGWEEPVVRGGTGGTLVGCPGFGGAMESLGSLGQGLPQGLAS